MLELVRGLLDTGASAVGVLGDSSGSSILPSYWTKSPLHPCRFPSKTFFILYLRRQDTRFSPKLTVYSPKIPKRRKLHRQDYPESLELSPNFSDLSPKIVCQPIN